MILQRKLIAIAIVGMLLVTGALLMMRGGAPARTIVPTMELPDDYIIFVDEPETEREMLLVSSLSSLAVRETYRPLFIITDQGPTPHQLNSISMMGRGSHTALYFSLRGEEPVFDWAGGLETFELNDDTLKHFLGFGGTITVASYEEALWASTIASIQGKLIVPGPATYKSQEEAWDQLNSMGVSANYVVVANPEDYRTDIFWSEGVRTKDDGEGLPSPEPYNASFHIPSLSIVASQLAQYHKGYVLTEIEPPTVDVHETHRRVVQFLIRQEVRNAPSDELLASRSYEGDLGHSSSTSPPLAAAGASHAGLGWDRVVDSGLARIMHSPRRH